MPAGSKHKLNARRLPEARVPCNQRAPVLLHGDLRMQQYSQGAAGRELVLGPAGEAFLGRCSGVARWGANEYERQANSVGAAKKTPDRMYRQATRSHRSVASLTLRGRVPTAGSDLAEFCLASHH